MRIGFGYDVHRMVEGRRLVLGGIEIVHDKGLLGHSDADVAIHALMDAMLGALALGDIGYHFPDTDLQYKNIDSKLLLVRVNELIRKQGYELGNLDLVIACQKPKLAPHIQAMRECLAKLLGATISQVSIKATTTEQLGFEGRGEGISAYCSVLLQEID